MIKKQLKPHQLEAVAKALPHPGFLLMMEQRTGKTLTALAIANERRPDFLLIVTTLKGKTVWEKEIKQSLKLDWKCEITIIHYQELHKRRAEFRKKFRKLGQYTQMVICDESHFIKRRGSQHARVVRSLGKLADWRLALTGTPLAPRSRTKRRKRSAPELTVTEGLEDAWSQFDFMDPEIFGKKEEFDETFLKTGGFRGFQIVGYKNKKKFYRLFHQYSYRKLLRDVQDVKTLICRHKVEFELSPKARKYYDSMDKKFYVDVNEGRVTIPVMVAKVTKLQQLTSGFLIDTEEERCHVLGRDKLDHLRKLLKDIYTRDHGRKVVICAKFVFEIECIRKLLRQLKLTSQLIRGGVDFKGEFDVDVTIMQIQSGVAIDLAKATAFIFFSMGHNWIDYEQARFRVLSMTQRRVDYYYLLAKRTIDELVYEAQTRKKLLSTLVLDHYRRLRQ